MDWHSGILGLSRTKRLTYGVGPGEFDTQWWNDTVGDARIARDCFFDDEVIFDVDGSFTNILGDETWIEEWQGADSNQCGTPIAPHDGTVNATYDFDEPANSLTITGVGAYLVNPAAFNGGELADPTSAPESITYNVYPQADGSMDVTIETDAGAWWNATYVKVGEIDPPSETEADFSLGFGGANFGEGGTYTVPSSAESWAGYANANFALYPDLRQGMVAGSPFMASAPEGVSVDVRFRLERLPYDENDPSATEPSIDTIAVTVTGSEPALYEILIDPQGEYLLVVHHVHRYTGRYGHHYRCHGGLWPGSEFADFTGGAFDGTTVDEGDVTPSHRVKVFKIGLVLPIPTRRCIR